MYLNKVLYNESCTNDAFFAAFTNFKKLSETPKKPPRRESIWDLENDTSESTDSSQNNRRFAKNDTRENSKSNDAYSYGRNSFYEVGDEAIWGNITDVKYPSNKIDTDSEMREIKPGDTNAANRNFSSENKNPTKSPIREKISFENGRLVKHSLKPEEYQSLRFNRVNEHISDKNETEMKISKKTKKISLKDNIDEYRDVEMKSEEEIEVMDVVRSKNKISTPEKYVSRKRPCISDINSFDPHPSNAVSNLFNASKDQGLLLTNKPLKTETHKSYINDDVKTKVEERSRVLHAALKENSGYDNIQRMSSEIKSLLNMPMKNSERNDTVWRTGQENFQISSKDLSNSPTSKKEFNRNAEVNWQSCWRNDIVRKTETDSNQIPRKDLSNSSTSKKEFNRTVEVNGQNCWTESNPPARAQNNTKHSFVKKESSSMDQDLNSRSPPFTGYKKVKSPSLDDWFKQREQTWKQRNSDSESDLIANKNNTTTIKSCVNEIGRKKDIPVTVKKSEREDGNEIKNSLIVNDSANGDGYGNKNNSANIMSCSSEERLSNKVIPETVKNFEREDEVKNKYSSTAVNNSAIQERLGNKNDSASKHTEKKKNIQKSSSVQSAGQICSEKDTLICLQVTGQNLTSDLTIERRMLEHVKSRRPELMKLIPIKNSETEEVPYSCEAIIILLRCLFSSYQKISSWKVALEIMSLSLKYNLKRLKKISEQYFSENPPTVQNVEEIIHNACYLKVLHHLNNVTKVEGSSLYQYLCITPLSMEFQYISSSCIVSSKLLVEPSEFCIPLNPMNHDFSASFKKDIRNVLVFEAIKGSYILTGIQIKFDVNSVEKVNIEYKVAKGNQMIISDEKEKRLRSLIILNFGKDVLVQPSEKAEVSIMIEDIQPRICSGASNLKCVQNSNGCHFTTELSSNVSPCLIFIEKLFYTVSL